MCGSARPPSASGHAMDPAVVERLLASVIEDDAPDRVVLLGELPELDTEAICARRGVTLQKLSVEDHQRLRDQEMQDLVVVGTALENLPRRAGEILLAGLRDLHARKVVLRLAPGKTWSTRDLIAFGFVRLLAADADGTCYFGFDIATYKSTPEWLSPRNWANPELFDKHRW